MGLSFWMALMIPAFEGSLSSIALSEMLFPDWAIFFMSLSCWLMVTSTRYANHSDANSNGKPMMVTRLAPITSNFSNLSILSIRSAGAMAVAAGAYSTVSHRIQFVMFRHHLATMMGETSLLGHLTPSVKGPAGTSPCGASSRGGL